jgi:hypothetical protein
MSSRDLVALAAAACVACCAGPILAVLGGLGALGIVSTLLIGVGGLLLAAAAVSATLVVRRRTMHAARTDFGPVRVELTRAPDEPRRRSERSAKSW